MTVSISTAAGDIEIQPISVGMKRGSDGQPLMELELKNPATEIATLKVEVPVGDQPRPRLESATLTLKLPMSRFLDVSDQ